MYMIIFLELFCSSIVSLSLPEIDVPSENPSWFITYSLVTSYRKELNCFVDLD